VSGSGLDLFFSLSLSCFLGDFDFRMDDGLFAPVVTVWGGAAVTGTLLPLRLPVRLPGPTLESRDCSRDRRLASVKGACSDLGFASSASSGRGFVYDVDRVGFSLAVAVAGAGAGASSSMDVLFCENENRSW